MNLINKYFDFKNKVVLITGCNGQIGTSLVNLYLELDTIVYGIDINFLKNNKKNFFFIQGDISNKNEIILKGQGALILKWKII